MMRGFTALAALAFILPADSAPAQQPPPLPPRDVIGDDVCAIMLDVRCDVSDSLGRPVQWAYVRQKSDSPDATFGASRATDAKGHLRAMMCYQGSQEYRDHPPSGQVVLEFTVSKPGFRSRVLKREVPAAMLLRNGLLLSQVDPFPMPIMPKKERPGYLVTLTVTMERKGAKP